MLFPFKTYDDYIMSSAFSLAGVKSLGIAREVETKVKEKGFVDFETNRFTLPSSLEISDVELLIDFYIGTILNSTEVNFLKANMLEQELPEEYTQFAEILAKEPILKWGNHCFATRYTQYNQLVLVYLESEFKNTDSELCFNLTVKPQLS